MKAFKYLVNEDQLVLDKYFVLVDHIDTYQKKMEAATDGELAAYTEKFKWILANKKKKLDDILPLAFAVVREAARRKTGEYPYREQLLCGIILHYGDCAEMKTGEGKTLSSLMPIYLNALENKGVIVVTVNEYLSQRDYEQNSKVLKFLNISAGFVSADHDYKVKQNAYSKSVTFVTNSELGFDYLRDNMVQDAKYEVNPRFNFVIVDECDSVLIDEARTPLIIAGGKRTYKYTYDEINSLTNKLNENHYVVDVESESVTLSKEGVTLVQNFFDIKNLFNYEHDELYHLLINALKANLIFENEVHYIIKEDKIVLVDKSTGRIMKGRSYSDGLHQAIEAKEQIPITEETTVISTISYQNLFRLFLKMGGMTGTAKTEEDEMLEIYNMKVLCCPTHKPLIRVDAPDYVFQNSKAKFKAILEEVDYRYKNKQPILIGTRNIDDSQYISDMLKQINIPHNVLNAKNHFKEAKIVASAGKECNVTIATNMAGRGTDIKLTKISRRKGGLCVIATDRFESRRIDNQLRGRSGRQGDPGYSRFFISLEDELIVRFGGKKLQKLFSLLHDAPLESHLLTRRLNYAQKKVEGMNFDSRKSLLEYDNVLSQQREIIFQERRNIVHSNEIFKEIIIIIEEIIFKICENFYFETETTSNYKYEEILRVIEGTYVPYGFILLDELKSNANDLVAYLSERIFQIYIDKRINYDSKIVNEIERTIVLSAIDFFWTRHIDDLVKLRSAIHLRSYGQKNPLQQYIEEATELFKIMQANTNHNIVTNLNMSDYNDYIDTFKQDREMQKINVKMN